MIRAAIGVSLSESANHGADLSRELTVYPADLTVPPPQDTEASFSWDSAAATPAGTLVQPVANLTPARPAQAVLAAAEASPAPPQAALQAAAPRGEQTARPFTAPGNSPGAVRAGDFVSRTLRDGRFTLTTVLLAILAAFGLGALHALSPGHGKTIVAAYLVGSRGTLKHALFLGGMVTFTHTVSVFLLGLGVLVFQQYVLPERIIPALGAVSGMSIVAIGSWLLYQRSNALLASGAASSAGFQPPAPAAVAGERDELELATTLVGHGNHHDHAHAHSHGDGHEHVHHSHVGEHAPHRHEHAGKGHQHGPAHDHGNGLVHTHTHNGHTHSHVLPDSRVTMGGLIALGVSGGLVPCPSALVLLLSAIALGQTALGLLLLVGFSAGLAGVLMAIGALVLYAKNLLPLSEARRNHSAFRLIPVFSAVVVIILGLFMTLTALGLVQPVRLLGSAGGPATKISGAVLGTTEGGSFAT